MKNKLIMTIAVLMLTVCLSGCGKIGPSKEPDAVGVSTTPGVSLTPTVVTPSLVPSVHPIVPDNDDDPTPHVEWEVHFTMKISDEAQKEIQQFVYDQGIDCRIDFVFDGYDKPGMEYEEWLNGRKAKNKVPDILSGCMWEMGIMKNIDFQREELMPLNEYFTTENGRKLADNFSKAEWAQVAVDNQIYRFPYRIADDTDDGIYLLINEKYKQYFDEMFDGTYESLMLIYETIGDEKLRIDSATNKYTVFAMLGMAKCNFFASFDSDERCFVNLLEDETMKELFLHIFGDYREGRVNFLQGNGSGYEPDDKTLVYIYHGGGLEVAGFEERLWIPDCFFTGNGITYGVRASSPRRELAKEVLCACYSDPEIASLLMWGYKDAENWIKTTAYMNTLQASEVTGFIPDLDKEERERLNDYSQTIESLIYGMFENRGDYFVINRNYESVVNRIYSGHKNYDDIFVKINSQLESWMTQGISPFSFE